MENLAEASTGWEISQNGYAHCGWISVYFFCEGSAQFQD
jgi:hypothetical protein